MHTPTHKPSTYPQAIPRPMTYAQRAIWSQSLVDPQNPAYILQVRFPLIGELNRAAMLDTLRTLPSRHEALRTTFVLDDEPLQIVHAEYAPDVQIHDVSMSADPGAEADQIALARESQPFDLTVGPPIRIDLVQLAPHRHELIITPHHIACDASSIPLLLRDIELTYRNILAGAPLTATTEQPAYPTSASDFWHSEAGQRRILRRAERMKGAENLKLPTDRPHSRYRSYQGGCYTFELDPALVADLKRRARTQRTSTFTVCLAAFALLLARHSQQRDLVIGVPTEGRGRTKDHDRVGCFANLVPVRINLGADPTFENLVQRLRGDVLDLVEDGDMPWELLLDQLDVQRDLSRPPLAQVSCQLLHAPDLRLDLPGLEVVELPPRFWVETRNGTSKFELSLHLALAGDSLVGAFEYSTDLFEAATIERWATRFMVLLAAAIAQPQVPVQRLPLLPAAERARVVQHWNATRAPVPHTPTLAALFEAQVDRTPTAPALVFGSQTFSYHALDVAANRLAHRLRRAGVGPEVLVGVCVERSVELVIALLAVLKAGAAYVPLDPEYPADRLAYMVADARAPLVLTQHHLRDRLGTLPAHIIAVDEAALDDAATSRLAPSAGPRNLAYVIYTSGSTGRPKGVMVEHEGICNYNSWMQKEFPLQPGDHFLQATSFSFDVSVYEIFWPLMVGATVVMVAPGQNLDPAQLGMLIREHQIVGLHLVPSLMSLFVEQVRPEDCHTLRYAFVSGEALEPALVRRFTERLPGDLINLYGATEVSVDSTFWRAPRQKRCERVLAGRPMHNQTIYVLDDALEPVPIGVTGDVYLGGRSVTRGYHGRPELTAERFLPDPFSDVSGSRIYQTGDLGRLLPDGNLELFGRRDYQVKLHGMRVELGEIEAALGEHPSVTQAVAVMQGHGDEALLVAFVTSREPDLDEQSLQSYAARRLPYGLVPTRIMILDQLPLSPNGKIDRKALPVATLSRASGPTAAFTPAEQLLADAWEEVLGQRPESPDTSFFGMGGNSIQVIRLVAHLRQVFDAEVSVRLVFEHQTVSAMAQAITAVHQPVTRRAASQDTHQVSQAQQRMWLLDQLSHGSPEYSMLVVLELTGELEIEVLRRALDHVVQRHESLRFRFPEAAGVPIRETLPPDVISLEVVAIDQSVDSSAIQTLLRERATAPFDLANGPLFRPLLLQRSRYEHLLLLTMHHSIADGWSIEVLLRDLARFYQDLLKADSPSETTAAPSYIHYIAWERSRIENGALEHDLQFWRQTLAGSPNETTFPADQARPLRRSGKGATFRTQLDPAVVRSVKAYVRERGMTPYTILFGSLAMLLHRLTEQTDLVLGTVTANRDAPGLEDLIGLCANTLAVRCRVAADDRAETVFEHVRTAMIDAYTHAAAPFATVVEGLKVDRDQGRTPLFQVMALHRSSSYGQVFDIPGMQAREIGLDSGVAQFDATFQFTDIGDDIELLVEYSTELFEAATVERWATRFTVLLAAAIAQPQVPVQRLPLLPSAERARVVQHWNATRAPVPHTATLAALFEAQVDRTPTAPALVFGSQTFSYHALDVAANRLAHRLRRAGLGPEVLVGVCVERSVELVIALLAVLKAGAAYVPLDPEYPADRLAYMVADARAPLVLTQHHLRDRLGPLAATVLVVDLLELDTEEATRLEPLAGPHNLAYVIYTSGSTGRPKGAMIEHRSVCNRIHWMARHYGFQPQDRILQKTPFSFDVSVWEFFATLCFGSTLVVAPPGVHREPQQLAELIEHTRTTIIHFVPSVLNYFLDTVDIARRCRSLRMIVCSGEALPPTVARRCLQTLSADLHNLYGPTEAAVDVSYFDCSHETWRDTVPIGHPIDNTQLYVLDRRLEPVPIGVLGELCIGGVNVGRGYLNNPGLTAERFVADPFSDEPGKRLYFTGDIARWRSDGVIEFLGRRDHQVKLRGLRIELGEIEAAIVEEHLARKAVVVVRGANTPNAALVAYVEADEPVALTTLRQALAHRLPAHMIPTSIIQIQALPLSPNGKLDRLALPAPVDSNVKSEAHDPTTDAERAIAEAWREILGSEAISVESDFFELGGHSLAASRVAAVLHRGLGVEVPLSTLIAYPVLKDLAVELDRLQSSEVERPPIVARPDRRNEAPLSSAQRRIWLDHQLHETGPVYNVPLAFRIRGELDEAALAAALHAMQLRHEVLRARVVDHDDEPRLVIMPEPGARLESIDLTDVDPAARQAALAELKHRAASQSFDLAAGPLLSAQLVRLGPSDHCLLLTIHHLVVDGASLDILWHDLAELYDQQRSRHAYTPVVSPDTITFTDYAWWESEQIIGDQWQQDIAFWKRALGDSAPFELPHTNDPRATIASGAEHPFELGQELSSVLRETATALRATPFMLLLAAFQHAVSEEASRSNVIVAVQVANRLPEVSAVVGPFINQIPFQALITADQTIDCTVRQVISGWREAIVHATIPFDVLLRGLAVVPGADGIALTSVGFSFVDTRGQSLRLDPAQVILDTAGRNATAKFDLLLEVLDTEQGFTGVIEYRRDHHTPLQISRLFTRWEARILDILSIESIDQGEEKI